MEHKSDYDGPDGGQPAGFYDPDMNSADMEEDEHILAAEVSERKLLAKIDFRVIPVLSVMYLLAFLDRTNIGNAVTFGLEKDLKLTSRKYDICLVVFFVSYCVFEIPSNILLKRFRPSRWLGLCMFFFGLITLCQGLVKSYSGLLAARFFLGIAETGMFPGSFYVISMYYKRAEAQKRYSFFFASTSLAGAFGGLVAYGIGHIKKPIITAADPTYEGAWRWVFIIEGAISCVLAFIWFFIIPDFPEDAKWLTEKERAFVRARIASDQGKSGFEKKVQGHDVLSFFKDYKVYLGACAYFGGIVSAYGYAYFAPTIIKGYHYSAIRTQLISVPPWATSFVFSLVIAYFSDKLRHRYFFCVFPLAVAIAGYGMLLTIHNHRNLQYGALFLVTSGTYGAIAIIVCWFQCNFGGHTRRAIGTAWQVGFGNLGGIVSVFIYPSKDAPDYKLGYGVSLAFVCFSLLSCTGLFLAYIFQNRSRGKSRVVEVSHYEELEKGDLAPTYRYML